MKFQQRVKKAKELSDKDFTATLSERGGRVTEVVVPGSSGKQYNVILRRSGDIISTECLLDTGAGALKCHGNSRGLCYHSIAAVTHAAKIKNMKSFWSANKENAQRRSNIGGQAFKVISRQSQFTRFVVVQETNMNEQAEALEVNNA